MQLNSLIFSDLWTVQESFQIKCVHIKSLDDESQNIYRTRSNKAATWKWVFVVGSAYLNEGVGGGRLATV